MLKHLIIFLFLLSSISSELKGIDVSYHNGEIDFSKVKTQVDFVIMRAGYGNKTIDSKELKELGIAETYEISGTEVKYTCESELLKKPVDITFELEDLGNNKYVFKMGDSFDFATVEVKGNTLSYEVGEKDPTKMIFKRQK